MDDTPRTATLGFLDELAEVGAALSPPCTSPSNVTSAKLEIYREEFDVICATCNLNEPLLLSLLIVARLSTVVELSEN